MRSWQLQEAKAKLSEVVKCSVRDGPQEISVRGEPAVVVLARAEYDRLRTRRPSLVEFLQESPLVGMELEFERDRTSPRETEL
jgi:prevent-host-death family protein